MRKGNAKYKKWLAELKNKIRGSQVKAAIQLNQSLLALYWDLGTEILDKQQKFGWGNSVVETLSKDLQKLFPEIQGFSARNLFYMQRWVEFYTAQRQKLQQPVAQLEHPVDTAKLQQAVAILPKPGFLPQPVAEIKDMIFQVPWGHHVLLLAKCKKNDEAFWYIQQVIENGWSRAVLDHQIERNLFSRQKRNKKVTNFSKTLPPLQSDLAEKTLKDPYVFDFLSLGKEAHERALENELTKHITQFLLELGKGFAYIGRQYHMEVGRDDFYIDLLFYNLHLRSYVVIDLKAGKFEPADVGQILFYVNAVDAKLKSHNDNPTIGIILCKDKNRIVAEYALANIGRPIGISEYKLRSAIPKNLKSSLPTIGELEEELNDYLRKKKIKKNKKQR